MVFLKQSPSTLVRSIVQAASRSENQDVSIVCQDGVITSNSFLLASLSPMLAVLLPQPDHQTVPLTLHLPDISSIQTTKALASLISEQDFLYTQDPGVRKVLDLLDIRTVLDTKQVVSLPSLQAVMTEPPFYCHIPELPDIESTELFDPEYLDDIEIEEEENLSLTIHSNDIELLSPATTKRKKGRRGRRSEDNKENKKKKDDNKEDKKKKEEIKENKKRKEANKKVETELNFSCLDCQKSFRCENQLKTHSRLHTTSNPGPEDPKEVTIARRGRGQGRHVCNFCGKCFKKLFQLTNHQRVHSGDRPFVCHTCGKAFSQEVSLRTHMRIHSGAKPYTCHLCQEAFNASNALAAHRQWKHNDGNRPFLCSFCSKSFPTKAAVRKHETIHRPTDRKHNCSLCEKKFGRVDHLKSHMRSHKETLDQKQQVV